MKVPSSPYVSEADLDEIEASLRSLDLPPAPLTPVRKVWPGVLWVILVPLAGLGFVLLALR